MKDGSQIWDSIAKPFHVTSTHSKAHRDKYQKVAEIIMSSNAHNVLDLGCGSGILEKTLYDMGYRDTIVAIDNSRAMLEIARELTAANQCCTYIRADLNRGIPLKQTFDVIVSINALFFIKNREKLFQQIRERLSNKRSVFILITPKPSKDASDLEFIKEHFSDTTWREKILIFINEVNNLPSYIRMKVNQNKLLHLEKRGEIVYDHPKSVEEMAKRINLNIISTEDIHAKQNWMFLMRRA